MSSNKKIKIDFFLDIICPYTYVAKKELDIALSQFAKSFPDVPVEIRITPFQIDKSLTQEPVSKREWYKKRLVIRRLLIDIYLNYGGVDVCF